LPYGPLSIASSGMPALVVAAAQSHWLTKKSLLERDG
jgi:hypothetical protein